MNAYWYVIALLLLILLALVFYFPATKTLPPPVTLPSKPSIPVHSSLPHNVRELMSAQEGIEFTKQKGLLMAYATWCGHCKNMMPALEEASTKTNLPIARLETNVAGDFLRVHEVRGFPTLLLSNSQGVVTKHTGGRDAASLLAALNALT
jgi:thiol-disulfide isomerase/thioredoxin